MFFSIDFPEIRHISAGKKAGRTPAKITDSARNNPAELRLENNLANSHQISEIVAGNLATFFRVHGLPGPRTKVFLLGFCVASQPRGPAALGCTAPGTSNKGICFGALHGPTGSQPRGFRVHDPQTSYNGISFRV